MATAAKLFSSHSVASHHANLRTILRKHGYDPRPQVSRQMPRVGLKWVGRCCLSIVTLGHAYPLSRLSVHHLLRDSRRKLSMKRNSFLTNHWSLFYLPTQSLTFILTENQWTLLKLTNTIKKLNSTSTTKTKNKQVYSQIKIHLNNITKIRKYKKPNYKVSKNKHTTDEDKNTLAH